MCGIIGTPPATSNELLSANKFFLFHFHSVQDIFHYSRCRWAFECDRSCVFSSCMKKGGSALRNAAVPSLFDGLLKSRQTLFFPLSSWYIFLKLSAQTVFAVRRPTIHSLLFSSPYASRLTLLSLFLSKLSHPGQVHPGRHLFHQKLNYFRATLSSGLSNSRLL